MTRLFMVLFCTAFTLITYSQGKSEYSEFEIPTKDGQAFYEKLIPLRVKQKTRFTKQQEKPFQTSLVVPRK